MFATFATRMVPSFLLIFISAECVSPVHGADLGQTSPPAFSAWYRFETPSALARSTGSTPWPGATRGVEWLSPGKGRWGGALHLSGTQGNGLYLPNPAAFFGKTARTGTIALWAKAGTSPGSKPRILFDFMVSTGNTLVDGYETVMFVQGDQLITWPALGRRMTVRNPLSNGAWVHLALAWDCTKDTALYVNGVRVAERRGAFKPTPLSRTWPGRIGCHTVSGGYAFAGDIDEVRVLNRRLDDREIVALYTLDPTLPSIHAVLRSDGTVAINNAGKQAVGIRFDCWTPGGVFSPPWHGYTPADFNQQIWTAGVTGTQPLGEPLQLMPAQQSTRAVTFPEDYLGPGRLRLMVGRGVARQELPLSSRTRRWIFRTITKKPRFGRLDRRGLELDVLRNRPVLQALKKDVSLPLQVRNETRRRVHGMIEFAMRRPGHAVLGTQSLPVDLAPGRKLQKSLVFPGVRLQARRYELLGKFRGQARKDSVLLLRTPIFGCDETSLSGTRAVGAAYVGNPTDSNVLSRMARDGVRVVRFASKRDGASFRQALADVLGHGLKIWDTPVFSYQQVCADPAKRDALRQWATELGTGLRDNFAVVDQTMAGEGLSYPPCYCKHCTRAFRDWLRRKYGSIVELNIAWNSKYDNWDEIEQLGSPADVDMAAERLKMMQVALELPKSNTERWKRLFELDRPRAMDWRRWHDTLLIDWYRGFSTAFRRANGGTVPLSEQPCWPNFKTHVFFPLAKIADAGGMDLYLPGEMKTTLGYAAELFMNFDMNASVYGRQRKPVMVHELYVQDLSPPGLAEAQGWWLVGRGYNLMTYFTYNYYHEGTRAGLPLVFGLFDKNWKPYPAYPSFEKFVAGLESFHKRFDLRTLRPPRARTAVFLGDDMSIANILETGGATWNAPGVKGHVGAYWLAERAGVPVTFVNDADLRNLGRDDALIVPWCPVIRPKSVQQILDVARRGGNILIDGAFAEFDDHYRRYPVIPGGAAAKALDIYCDGFVREKTEIFWEDQDGRKHRTTGWGFPRNLVALYPQEWKLHSRIVATGEKGTGASDQSEPIMPALLRRKVGRGHVSWRLSALGPVNRSRAPAPDTVRFGRWGCSGRSSLTARFVPAESTGNKAVPKDLDHGGKGIADPAPLTDVSARIQDDRDVFLFVTNFFAPSRGYVKVHLPENMFSVSEVLTGRPVHAKFGLRSVRIPIAMDAFDAQVIRLRYTGRRRAPLADW